MKAMGTPSLRTNISESTILLSSTPALITVTLLSFSISSASLLLLGLNSLPRNCSILGSDHHFLKRTTNATDSKQHLASKVAGCSSAPHRPLPPLTQCWCHYLLPWSLLAESLLLTWYLSGRKNT